jgi:hypothetical protein
VSCGGGSFTHVSCHVGADWRVRCNTCPDTTPILSLDAGSSAISVTTTGKDADKAAVEFARALVSAAQKFADEVERMHAAQFDGSDSTHKAAGSNAA